MPFARAAYNHWGAHLGVDPARWPDGFFGENLTFDELDETELRVGDVFALGDEVRVFVAGARNPCVKLSWRLGQPPTFQMVFAKSRRAGVYMGVDAPGTVRPGDRLQRVHHDSAMPSVAEVSAFLIDREVPPLEPLRRLLAYGRLSPTNRMLLSAKLDAAEHAAEAVEGRWRGWRTFTAARIVAETQEVRSVELVPTDGGRLCAARPGQFVTLRLDGPDPEPVTRCWSLSRFDDAPSTYRITVRRQEGKGSRRLHGLREGDTVLVRGPAGEFTLNRGTFRPVLLIAAGIGVTPLKAMLDAHLSRPGAPSVHLIYGARDPASAIFREELEKLAETREGFQLTMVYSRGDVPGALKGRITADLVIGTASELEVILNGEHHAVPWFEAEIYICGPGDLCRALTSEFTARGANPDRVFHELFAALPVETTAIGSAEVIFASSGRCAEWRAEEDLSLLELAEASGIEVPYSCRAGSCLTCQSRLLGGEATGAIGDGTVLPCIARPASARVELEL